MSIRRRYLWPALLGAVVATAAALAACGPSAGGSGGGATPVPSATAVPPTETPIPTPTATPTPLPTPTPDPTFPMKTTHFSYGINADLYYRESIPFPKLPDEVMGYVEDLGMEWVRVQVSWADVEPEQGTYRWEALDTIVDIVGRHNRKLLVSIVRSPTWATADGGHGMPADPNSLGDFLMAMAARYKNRIQAYEIWNEQNYAVENDGYVEGAGRYVELLKVAYARIKGADPLAFVLFGPCTPTGWDDPAVSIPDIRYLHEAYEYNDGEVKGYFDVLGAHVGGTHNPPDTLWPDNPGPFENWQNDSTFYFRHVENIRQVMVDHGDGGKQIWLTEFGWASIDGIVDTPSPGYEYAANISAGLQGDYVAWALDIGRTQYQPWMGAMFVWNLNFSTFNAPTDEKSAFSMLRPDWGTRPSYRAVRAYIAEHMTWPE